MRRAIMAATLGGVLLITAACESDAKTTAGAASTAPSLAPPSLAPTSAPPDYSANTRGVCDRIDKVFDADVAAFGTEIGKLITYKEEKLAAQAKAAQAAAAKRLTTVGDNIRKETAKAQDPYLRTAGEASSAKFAKAAGDDAFYTKIKSNADFDRVIESQLSEWFSPVAGFCS
jgi:hypothetical protein